MIKRKYIFLFITLPFFLGCNELLFQLPMPKESSQLNKFPDELLGTYLEVYFSNYKVDGIITEVRKEGRGKYIIEREYVVYVDSVEWIGQGGIKIDTVIIEDGAVHVITEKETFTLSICDTIKSSEWSIAKLDFKKNKFIEFKEEESYTGTTENGEMKLFYYKENYFLNTKSSYGYWLVKKIEPKKDYLEITETSFDLDEKNKPIFEKMKHEYEIDLLPRKGKDWKKFLTNPSNMEFETMMKNENAFFNSVRWMKIKDVDSDYWRMLYVVVGVVLLFGLFVIKRRK